MQKKSFMGLLVACILSSCAPSDSMDAPSGQPLADQGLGVWQAYFQQNPAEYALFDIDQDGILEAFVRTPLETNEAENPSYDYRIFACGGQCQNVQPVFQFKGKGNQRDIKIIRNTPVVYATEQGQDFDAAWHLKFANSTLVFSLHSEADQGNMFFSANNQPIDALQMIEKQTQELSELQGFDHPLASVFSIQTLDSWQSASGQSKPPETAKQTEQKDAT